jgi:hypothetical protein
MEHAQAFFTLNERVVNGFKIMEGLLDRHGHSVNTFKF